VTERHRAGHALPFRRTPVATCHRTSDAALIDEDEVRRIDPFDLGAPSLPLLLIGFGITFAGVQ
jgi:hypothetical protein